MNVKTIKGVGMCVVLGILASTLPMSADTYWINPGSGNVTNGSNWSSGLPLNSGQGTAFFTNNASYTVTYPNAVTYADQVSFNAQSGTVTNAMPGGGNFLQPNGGFFVGDAAGSTATVVQISGAMYTLGTGLVIGNNGVGNFTLAGPAGITAGNNVLIGYHSGSAGSTFVLTNGANLGSSSFSEIGIDAGANNNTVLLTGLGTIWTDAYHNYVGVSGAGNTLRIENGASFVKGGYVEYIGLNAGASNNTMIVTGTNTTWTVTDAGGFDLRVGNSGANNTLIISNGATAKINGAATVYVGAFSADNNLRISGPNSSLTMTNAAANMYVGLEYANNHLVIDNGGRLVMGGNFFVGYADDYNVNSNNTVLVTGPNSYMGIGGNSLGVGVEYSLPAGAHGGDSFVISNGASVKFDGTDAKVGYWYAGGSSFRVTGPGSVFSNTAANFGVGFYHVGSRLQVDNGGSFVGSNVTIAAGNTLTVTNGGSVVLSDKLTLNGSATLNLVGGTLQTRNSTASGTTIVGGGPDTATWTMTGGSNTLGVLFTGNKGGLIVTNGSSLQTSQFDGGYNGSLAATANNSLMVVSGPGTVWSNASGAQFILGYNGAGNTLRIENGASVFAPGTGTGLNYIGDQGAQSSNNTMLVTGANSLWQGNGDFRVGNYGAGNSLVVSNGAKVQNDGIYMFLGTFTSASNSSLTVTGPGSTLYMTNTTGRATVGYQAPNNRLLIDNGGQMFSFASSGASRMFVGENAASASNNTITVTGSNSLWRIYANPANSVSEFSFGNLSAGNSMVISNGGKVQYDGRYFEIGTFAGNNSVSVTGAGSVFSNANANFYVGYQGLNNRLQINNGGQFYGSNVLVASSGSYTGNGIDVRSGGLFDANLVSVFNGNYITNFGGIYQFSTASPSLTTGTAMVLTNGMVSFRNIANAPTAPVTGITYQGVNDYQLNSASNAVVALYTFDTGLGASNYKKLQLVGDHPTWQGTALTVGSGGSLVVSNATGAGITAAVTNSGTIMVDHSTVTWSGKVLINGKYISDPSTNTYLADVTVGQSGTMAGGAGDLFDFKKSLYINATNNIGFQLANSAVMFSGGGMHTNAITGQDLGHDAAAFNAAYVTQTNFAYGELHLGSAADQICFTCGNIPTIASNGLYVGWLDLLGSASLVTNLHAASGINIYYNMDDVRNSYLSGATYQLTDCNFATGGGFLMGIPEPSSMMLVAAAAGLLLRRKSNRA